MHRFLKTVPPALTALTLVLAVAGSTLAGDAEPNTLNLGLGGYSPVSYFHEAGPQPCSPLHRATHDGVTYFFASADEVETFNKHPEKYTPAYDGWCAYGMAVEGKFDADPTNYKIIDGKINVFLKNDELDTRELWNRGDEQELITKAHTFWSKLDSRPSRAYLGARNVGADGVALGGYSPVSYFSKGYAEKGDPAMTVEHDGLTYRFADAEQAEAFKADPEKYVPAYGGWCAFGMSISDKFPVDPTAFKIVDDKLHVFLRNADIDARKLWIEGDAAELTKKADAHWRKVQG